MTKTKIQTIFILLLISLLSSPFIAHTQSSVSGINKLDDFIKEIREEYGIPGIALAVVKDGKVIHKNNYGYANLEHEVPVHDESLFRLYSLTKPFIAVAIFSLIEEDRLDLDDSISKYLFDIPSIWKKIKIKHLLTHSSGLPDVVGRDPFEFRDQSEEAVRDRVYNATIRFKEGAKFEYNQTNYWLLKNIIENVSQSSLSDFMIKNQFPNAKKGSVCFSSDARDIIKYRTTSYFPWLKGTLCIEHPYVKGEYAYAANGLHLTLDNFIEWDKQFQKNKLLTSNSKKEMWQIFHYDNPNEVFTYGWGVADLGDRRGYGFSGSMSTIYRTYPADNLSIIFLSNGFTKMYNQNTLMNQMTNIILE